MWDGVFALAGLIGPVGIIAALVTLALLSQRLGSVTRMPPHYRLLYAAAGLVGLAICVRLATLSIRHDGLALLYHVFVALGVTLGLAIAWRYWQWLFGER